MDEEVAGAATEMARERAVFATQTAILERVARGESLDGVLDALCLMIEELSPGATCSVLALDTEHGVLRPVAGPNLDPEYAQALDGLTPAEGAGSCGTAAFRGTPVLVCDTETDPLWDEFRELARRHRVRSCWSIPIRSPQDEVLGTFAISHEHPTEPCTFTQLLLRTASHLAGIALQRDRTLAMQRKAEGEAQNRQRLESLGVLAGGIAHDFNNLLTSILGNLSMAEAHVHSEPVRGFLTAAEEACEQSRALTSRFLAFAKGGEPVREPVDLAAVIDDSAAVSLAGSNAELCWQSATSPLHAVDGDRSQLFQVFHNLFLNAAQATPKGGMIRVSAVPETISEESESPLAPGRYARVEVSDSGEGIQEGDIDRIFDPYFSTKPGGSGLGLSSVYSILLSNSGHVTVESKAGDGTTFTLWLPESKSAPSTAGASCEAPGTCEGRLLLMDDEPIVRKVAETLLAEAGFEVVCAADGAEAVKLFEEALASAPFDVVVLDLTVRGGMGGAEAIQHVRAVDPHVPTVVASGYSDDAVLADPAAHGFTIGVAKPFRSRELISAVCSAIDACARTPQKAGQ